MGSFYSSYNSNIFVCEIVSMKTLTIIRTLQKDGATWGVLVPVGGVPYFTMEREWKDNLPFESCIPALEYKVERDTTGKFKFFKIKDVPDRTAIEIHPANRPVELAGCIAFGEGIKEINGKLVLMDSGFAVDRFKEYMSEESWTLKIETREERERLPEEKAEYYCDLKAMIDNKGYIHGYNNWRERNFKQNKKEMVIEWPDY